MEHQLITLLRITTPLLGNFVKNRLEAEGIEIFFTNEGLTLGSQYNPNEVLLKVKAGQSEKAINILLQLHKDYDLEKVALDETIEDMKKILVPVKLGTNCIDLCRYAMGLAVKTNAEVKLLYVYPDPNFNEPGKNTASWEKHVKMQLKDAFNKAQLKLVNFSKELKATIPEELYNASRIHYRMLKGTPVNVINDACNRYKPDVILMGTAVDRDKSGEFWGKTLLKVINHSSIPILVVPFSAEYKGKDKVNVMYATNFYDTDNAALNSLLAILGQFDKVVHCVHIDVKQETGYQQKVDELNKMLEEEYSEHNIQCKLFESDSVIGGMDDFVQKNNIDIISVSKVRHSAIYNLFHTDLVEKLLALERVPILVFPEK